jgi:hypothetical protein
MRHGSGGGVSSEHEDINVLELSAIEAMRQVGCGEIADAKTIIAILWCAANKWNGV